MLAGTCGAMARAYLDELFEIVLILLGAAGAAVQAVVGRSQRRDAQSITSNRNIAFYFIQIWELRATSTLTIVIGRTSCHPTLCGHILFF